MNQRGLTLVEVLVALGIFSMVSAIGIGALGLAANGSEQLETAMARTGELERMRSLLRADLYQLTDRPVKEPYGTRPRAPFMGGRALGDLLDNDELGGEALLALVRTGWANPGAEEPRAEVQAVTWLVRDDQLIRRHRPFLDAAPETPSREDVLLTGLSDVEIEFLVLGRWRDEVGGPVGRGEPEALRLSFEHPAYGEMQHLFLLKGARR